MAPKTTFVEEAVSRAESHVRKGELDRACEFYQAVLAKYPNNKRALDGLRAVRSKIGNRSSPALTPDQLNGIVALHSRGRHHAALSAAQDLLRTHPDVPVLYNILGVVHASLGQMDQALESFDRAIGIKPDYADALNNLGNALNDLGRYEDAVPVFRRALNITPKSTAAHNNLGNALYALGEHAEAKASYHLAIEAKPGNAEAHNNLGNALSALGRQSEAKANYRMAVQFKPDYAEAHRNLSSLKTYESGDLQIDQMLELAEADNASDSDRMHLSFALGKAHEDIGEFDKAFRFFVAGNALRKRELHYDIASDERLFHHLKSLFGAETVTLTDAELADAACQHTPVFIVGMPRSGTTLCEQILASHSDVHGAGELDILTRAVDPVIADSALNPSQPLSRQQLNAVRRTYCSGLLKKQAAARLITDKMPLNFRWIGFILASLPEAKIVHMRRDAPATCWSLYKHFFQSRGNGYSYDLQDVARFYRLYLDLMSFWEKRYPGKIYHLRYEALTEDQLEETRRLLDHCGLDWEDACLEFNKTERVVATASAAQVRRSMYQGSSKAWQKFEKGLQPMLIELDGCD